MLRSLAAVALATSVVAVAAPASAQDNTARPMGLRFELAMSESLNLATLGGGPDTNNNVVSPTGDIKIGYDIGQFTPLIGLSYLSFSRDLTKDTSASSSAFIVDIEARYFFKPHRKGLNPFVFGEFNTAFTSIGSDPEAEGDAADEQDRDASELDFTEVNVGLGMEYKFDGASFAIGGKWGLGFAFNDIDTLVGTEEQTLSNTTIGTVGAIYAAWRL
jgi:hypothetical protein